MRLLDRGYGRGKGVTWSAHSGHCGTVPGPVCQAVLRLPWAGSSAGAGPDSELQRGSATGRGLPRPHPPSAGRLRHIQLLEYAALGHQTTKVETSQTVPLPKTGTDLHHMRQSGTAPIRPLCSAHAGSCRCANLKLCPISRTSSTTSTPYKGAFDGHLP